MLATYAASRHRQIVPCCMISSVSHDNVSRLVTDRSMCFATALDKAFENIDCMSAILRCQAKNRFYESTQRLIQPRRVLWQGIQNGGKCGCMPETMMSLTRSRSSDTSVTRCAWEPPAFIELKIGTETKSSRDGGSTAQSSEPAPLPPAAPAAKLGFSLEWAFP